jgi:hypothetical protein
MSTKFIYIYTVNLCDFKIGDIVLKDHKNIIVSKDL